MSQRIIPGSNKHHHVFPTDMTEVVHCLSLRYKLFTPVDQTSEKDSDESCCNTTFLVWANEAKAISISDEPCLACSVRTARMRRSLHLEDTSWCEEIGDAR